MLSRVAGYLYWIGRYIERAENIARYTKEIYFSSIDAPMEEVDARKFVLESMLYMVGIFDMEHINEKDVLYKIGLDPENSNSLLSIITSARENARGARNEISTEVWESINTYYHFVNNYPVDTFLTKGLYDFTQKILEQTSVVQGKIFGSMLHDEGWSIISCSMYVERSLQMIRILNTKLHDIYKIENMGLPVNKMSFEWATLLRCTESFDMNRKYYRSIPNRDQVLEFLLLNPQNPRSLQFNIRGINKYLDNLLRTKVAEPGSVEFKLQKLHAHYQYLTVDEFKDDVYQLLNYTHDVLVEVSEELENNYLAY